MKTIFVSSTFRDMQLERDALQQLSLPAINALAKTYGEKVAMCDLRWGVNTSGLSEEESTAKVLNHCLDAIDRCEPIMIILLGERYGWIPGTDAIRSASDRKQLQLEDYEISVTALEIEYGAFFRSAKTLVYFREADDAWEGSLTDEDDTHREKLAALKDKLAGLCHNNIKSYRLSRQGETVVGLDAFANMVKQDVAALLTEEWHRYQNVSAESREQLIHQGLFFEKAASFHAGESFLASVKQTITQKGKIINLYGEAGCGKSVLLGKLAKDLAQEGYDILPLQVGATKRSSTYRGALSYLNGYFRENLHFTSEHDNGSDTAGDVTSFYDMDIKDVSMMTIYRTVFNKTDSSEETEALKEYTEQYETTGRKLVIFIDGLHLFHYDRGEDASCIFPSNLMELSSITIVVSSSEPLAGLPFTNIEIPQYQNEDNRKIIEVGLSRTNREVDAEVMTALLNKCVGKPPLYIQFLLQKLLMMNADNFAVMKDMKTITAEQLSVIASAPDTLSSLGYAVLRDGAERIAPHFLHLIPEYLSLSQEGLTEVELAALCGKCFDKADFYSFITYMGNFFVLRQNGRLDFANAFLHTEFAETVEDRAQKVERLLTLLLDEFATEQITAPKPDFSIVQEIAYTCLQHASSEVFMHTVLRFHHTLSALAEQDDSLSRIVLHSKQALMLSLEDHTDQLIAHMLALDETTTDPVDRQDLLAFFNILEESSLDLYDHIGVGERYLALLKEAEDTPEVRCHIARLADSMYTHYRLQAECELSECERLFLQMLNACSMAFNTVSVAEADEPMKFVYKALLEDEHIKDYNGLIQLTIETMLEQFAAVQKAVLQLPASQLPSLIRQYWCALQLYGLYAYYHFTQDRESYDKQFSNLVSLLVAYLLSKPNVKAHFNEMASTDVVHLYDTVAQAATARARQNPNAETIKTAIAWCRRHHRAKPRKERQDDACRFWQNLVDLYDLKEELFGKKSIACLKKIVGDKGTTLSHLGKKFRAANEIFKRLDNIKYAKKALDVMLQLTERYCRIESAYSLDDVLENLLYFLSEDETAINDTFYINDSLQEDLETALALSQTLANCGIDCSESAAAIEAALQKHAIYLAEHPSDDEDTQ